VRTPEFKAWFGDWTAQAEYRAKVQRLLDGDVVETLTGQELPKSEGSLRDQAWKVFGEFNYRVVNPDIGQIALTRAGIKATIYHGLNREKIAAFRAVKNVVENGVIINHSKNWKGRGYDTSVVCAKIRIGETDYICEVIVRTVEGHPNRFYLHEVNARKALADTLQTPTGRASTSESARPVSSIFVDKYQEVKGETSKVVDENGEPLVVYHVTDSDFNTFDRKSPIALTR